MLFLVVIALGLMFGGLRKGTRADGLGAPAPVSAQRPAPAHPDPRLGDPGPAARSGAVRGGGILRVSRRIILRVSSRAGEWA